MTWHLIEGDAGCRFAIERGCVAVIVDALRASATAAMLLHAGARELLVVSTVEDAFRAKEAMPDALLFGERGGLPPPGFDGGNSPREVAAAAGRAVIFTTTTGAQRLIAAWGAPAVYLGTTVNATATINAASARGTDVVLIPAGLAGQPDFNAQEDWAAATAIAMRAYAAIGEGRGRFEHWRDRIEADELPALFATSPHAEKLRRVGLADDIPYCAQLDLTDAVPRAVGRNDWGILVRSNLDEPR